MLGSQHEDSHDFFNWVGAAADFWLAPLILMEKLLRGLLRGLGMIFIAVVCLTFLWSWTAFSDVNHFWEAAQQGQPFMWNNPAWNNPSVLDPHRPAFLGYDMTMSPEYIQRRVDSWYSSHEDDTFMYPWCYAPFYTGMWSKLFIVLCYLSMPLGIFLLFIRRMGRRR